MDRVAQLAACADIALRGERYGAMMRELTRQALAEIAANLGFPENEISSAIDTALGGR